jgi:hypothetical protein
MRSGTYLTREYSFTAIRTGWYTTAPTTADDPQYPEDPASIKLINNAVSGSMRLIKGAASVEFPPPIDAGTHIPTDNAIDAPDISAYEYGAAP